MVNAVRRTAGLAGASAAVGALLSAGAAHGLDAAPDQARGGKIAFKLDRSIAIVRADGTGRRIPRPGGANQFSPEWSPDGRRLLYVTGDTLTFAAFTNNVWVLPTGGRPRAVLSKAFLRRVRPAIGSATWSPDGKRIAFLAIAYGLNREAIFIVGADGRNIQRVWSMRMHSSGRLVGPEANSLAWSPDGRRLAFSIGTGRPALHVFTLRTRRLQRLHTLEWTSDGLMPGLDWSPDSRSIVFTGVVPVARPRGDPAPKPAVTVLSLSGGQPRTVVAPTLDPGAGGRNRSETQAFAPTFSPDGREIAFYQYSMQCTTPTSCVERLTLSRIGRNGVGLRPVTELPAFRKSAAYITSDLLQPSWSR